MAEMPSVGGRHSCSKGRPRVLVLRLKVMTLGSKEETSYSGSGRIVVVFVFVVVLLDYSRSERCSCDERALTTSCCSRLCPAAPSIEDELIWYLRPISLSLP